MSIETNLERIANALEVLASATLRDEKILNAAIEAEVLGAPPEPEEKTPSYAEQRKAEIKAETAAAKKRGRPAGSTNKPKDPPAVTEPESTPPVVEDETDPFAEEPVVAAEPEKAVTLEDLRPVLVELRTKVGKDKAYAIMREHGGGASFLPGSTVGNKAGGPGELKPEFFAPLLKAAKKALAA